jgi:branched-chain amino acid transport system ATP-binding protein
VSVLLRIDAVSSSYGRVRALSDVSLQVSAGELVALVGGNGAGKTTLLSCVSGVHGIHTGAIAFDGENLAGVDTADRVARGIAHVPEGRLVFPGLSVEDNLVLGAFRRKNSSMARDDIYSLFPKLAERRRQLAGTLSGGEQQMLALGRALMSDPKLLLLDEPSMGLAPILVEQIFDTIERLRETGKTILLVEQNATAALALADRGYVIEAGRVVLSGSGSELSSDMRVRNSYLGIREA